MPIRLSKVPKCGALEVLIPSWERSLRAANHSPPTIRADGGVARLFDQFCRVSLGQLTIDQITREHIETDRTPIADPLAMRAVAVLVGEARPRRTQLDFASCARCGVG